MPQTGCITGPMVIVIGPGGRGQGVAEEEEDKDGPVEIFPVMLSLNKGSQPEP
jgi:hypothetical protein